MDAKKRKRVLWSDIEALCAPLDAQVIQHPITRSIMLMNNSGQWTFLKIPRTGEIISGINQISLTEWKVCLDSSMLELNIKK